MNSWCECKNTIGYASLLDVHNTFVCVQCWRPSYLVYDKSHKLCEECGGSFYSAWEVNCHPCNTELMNLAFEVQDAGDLQEAIDIIARVSDPWTGWDEFRHTAILVTQSRNGATAPTRMPSDRPHVPPKPR